MSDNTSVGTRILGKRALACRLFPKYDTMRDCKFLYLSVCLCTTTTVQDNRNSTRFLRSADLRPIFQQPVLLYLYSDVMLETDECRDIPSHTFTQSRHLEQYLRFFDRISRSFLCLTHMFHSTTYRSPDLAQGSSSCSQTGLRYFQISRLCVCRRPRSFALHRCSRSRRPPRQCDNRNPARMDCAQCASRHFEGCPFPQVAYVVVLHPQTATGVHR